MLKRLGVDFIDLLLIDPPMKNWRKGYKKIVKAYKKGLARAIGVCNFEGEYLTQLLNEFDVKPQVIQVKCHPLYPQHELEEICNKENIRIMNWYPLGYRESVTTILDNEEIKKIANKYHKTTSQVVLRWHIQKGRIPTPTSKNKEYIIENITIFDFKLTDEDIAVIDKLGEGIKIHPISQEKFEKFKKQKPKYEKIK